MPEPREPVKSKLPRDSAGRLDLHGGTGGITEACSCGEFLEVYKEDMTFRIRTPESIDPSRTNPNARGQLMAGYFRAVLSGMLSTDIIMSKDHHAYLHTSRDRRRRADI